MRDLTEIIGHCPATRPNWRESQKIAIKPGEIKHWHLDLLWTDIGYHFVIDLDGTLVTGRPLAPMGAYGNGHNEDTIGVALMGGHGSAKKYFFSNYFTTEQGRAPSRCIADLKDQYPVIKTVGGHIKYAAKACPGLMSPAF